MTNCSSSNNNLVCFMLIPIIQGQLAVIFNERSQHADINTS